MLKENAFILVAFAIGVLILILMEHAQRELNHLFTFKFIHYVLILILMEHAQRGNHGLVFNI